MDAANPTPPATDASHPARHGSPESVEVAAVAQRWAGNAAAFGSPVRRPPRLSCLPPPQPLVESQDTQDDSSDDESESVNNVALHLSRDETPDNDDLFPDEPSTVLASKIMRAHDNPSPPPQDLAHPGINYIPGKDGQFPLSSISVPPSPFRPINLLERLNQSSNSVFEPSRSDQVLGVQSDRTVPNTTSSGGSISPESNSPFISTPSASTKGVPHVDLASTDTIHSSTSQCTVSDPIPHSPQHIIITSSHESVVRSLASTQAVVSSLNPPIPSASDDYPRDPLPCSEQLQSVVKPSPRLPDSKPLSSSNMASADTETMAPGGRDNGREEAEGDDSRVPSKCEQESKHRATGTKEVDTDPPQRLDSLSPQSNSVLVELCLSSESTTSIDQMVFPAKSIPINPPPAPLPQTPIRVVPRPDFTRTSVQRPVIAPTPMRAGSARKLNSPAKLSLQVDHQYRTPAKRVPIETALTRGTSSLQKRTQPSTESEQSRPGPSQTIRAPVFTRPALEDPSRSPAKRIPMTDFPTSPTKGYQSQSSPTRLVLRARSASVEPRPSGANAARSRSVEPCTMISKPDGHGKIKESLFPMPPLLPRTGSKLPFPLTSSQKSKSDLPPPIPEEPENAEIGHSETEVTQGKEGKMVSQLRQPSANSRIPRIGNKPYARPPKNGRAVVGATTGDTTRAPSAPPFRPACKDSGIANGDMELSSTQPVGSLKRKRGTETATPHPVMLRQVVPGILNNKYAPKSAKMSQALVLPEPSSPKVPQPLKFRRVVDGMLSARYAPAKPNITRTELPGSTSPPPSPLSELSSSSNEESSGDKLLSTTSPPADPKGDTSDTPRTNVDVSVLEPSAQEHFSLRQDADNNPSNRPRRTSRTRKPAQQQYVLDIFNNNPPTRPPLPRRRPQPRPEIDCFMGMSATALKALTTSNTTKNQQTIAMLATEVIRKDGLRPESPAVKARTILQKQRDERDTRRRERAQRRARMSDDSFEGTELQTELENNVSPSGCVDEDENNPGSPQKHCRGPGDEEDYVTPERPGRIIEPLKLEGVDGMVKPVKQVKWHRGLSTTVYVDEVDPKPKSLSKNVVTRGCLAPTSKNLPLDHLGNLVDMDNRQFPELATEHIVVKRYLYDNDIEPEPVPAPAKMTRSRSKKNKS